MKPTKKHPVAKAKKKKRLAEAKPRRYHTDQEMLEHVKSYMDEKHWKVIRNGIERRQFGNIDFAILYFMLKPNDDKLVPSYRYQIYNNGIPRAGGGISAQA